MKIVVCVKYVPDTAIKVKIAPDGKSVNLADISYVVNPYDEFAVEEALRIKEKSGGEVMVVGAGAKKRWPVCAPAWQWAPIRVSCSG